MLRHPESGARDHERRRGGDVKRAGAIAAGAAGIDQVRALRAHLDGVGAHRLREPGDLVYALAFHLERSEQRRGLCGRGLPGHDGVHQRRCLRAGEIHAGGGFAHGVHDGRGALLGSRPGRCRARRGRMHALRGPGLRLHGDTGEEVPEELLAVLRQDRLRVELHPLDGILAVADPHHFSLVGGRGDLEALGQALLPKDQRVIARRLERRGQAGEETLAIMVDGRCLPVHQARRANDLRAKGVANRLMAQAHPQDRHAPGKAPHHLDGEAGLLRGAGPRREDDPLWGEALDVVQGELVVAEDGELLAHLREVLHQVVGERVVVVNNENHPVPPSKGPSRPLRWHAGGRALC